MEISLKSLKINNIADLFQSFCRGKCDFYDYFDNANWLSYTLSHEMHDFLGKKLYAANAPN